MYFRVKVRFTINLVQPDYWWLRSPYTHNDAFACLVDPDGDVVYYDFNVDHVDNSYGTLRSPVTVNTIIRSSRMATSITTTAVCTIPTEITDIIHLSGMYILPTKARV